MTTNRPGKTSIEWFAGRKKIREIRSAHEKAEKAFRITAPVDRSTVYRKPKWATDQDGFSMDISEIPDDFGEETFEVEMDKPWHRE